MRAEYFHGGWDGFAHTFEKSCFSKKSVWCFFSVIITCVLNPVTFFYVSDNVPQAKWPYQPWDHSIVFMKQSLWHVIYQSSLCFSCKTCFLDCLYNLYNSWCAPYSVICICISTYPYPIPPPHALPPAWVVECRNTAICVYIEDLIILLVG